MSRPADLAALLDGLESAVRRDPARRGLLSAGGAAPLGLGELAGAARSLAGSAGHVVLVTGFYIPSAEPPAAETDGPPGTVALAATLRRLGAAVTIVTDPWCGAAVAAAARAGGLDDSSVRVCDSPEAFSAFLASAVPSVGHLIAVERVGPCWNPDGVRLRCGDAAAERFGGLVPAECCGFPHNMRGRRIDDWTVDFSGPFERPPAGVTTIGLGDGGNEIGFGKFAWGDLADRLAGIADPRIVCRVACDFAVLAGTSNWAAYALAAATATVAGRPDAFADVTAESQERILEAMVAGGPAVDGVTGRREPTVDGLPTVTFLQPLVTLRRRLGLRD